MRFILHLLAVGSLLMTSAVQSAPETADAPKIPCAEVRSGFTQQLNQALLSTPDVSAAGLVETQAAGQAALGAWCPPEGATAAARPFVAIAEFVTGMALPDSCFSFRAPAGAGIYCVNWCAWLPHSPMVYSVGLRAYDEVTDVVPVVFGGVGCGNEVYLYLPPLGLACAGVGSCEASTDGGMALNWGSCLFYAAAASPHIKDAHCEF